MLEQSGSRPVTANDHFFLDHLQSVQAETAWYYNQRFLGRGGNGTAFLVTCSSGPNIGTGFNPQLQPDKVTDPIKLDLREIKGNQGKKLFFLIKAMLREQPSSRPTASRCIARLNIIHKAFCQALFDVSGQHV